MIQNPPQLGRAWPALAGVGRGNLNFRKSHSFLHQAPDIVLAKINKVKKITYLTGWNFFLQDKMNQDLDLFWQEIQKDNEAALEKVFRIVFKPLVYYAKEITCQHHLAEEIVQDVMMKIWEKRSEIVIKGSFKAYLFSSVHNQALNTLRELSTRKAAVNQTCSEKMMEFLSETFCSDDNFIDKIFSDETELVIEVTIRELPPQCRDIFCKSRFEKMNNSEIARQMGISENTVKTHIYRALHKISIALEKKM